MSVTKLLSRIVAPGRHSNEQHDHTYGITSDPLTQFACVMASLIHDCDHPGGEAQNVCQFASLAHRAHRIVVFVYFAVPNAQLVKEEADVAKFYRNKSVAEQNSLDLAWNLLMDDSYTDLRKTIYTTQKGLERFRALMVNCVMATDIVDKDLKDLRNGRWAEAFSEKNCNSRSKEAMDRKATIVIEHLLQASDVAHMMQHWHVYRRWNERFFFECYKAYKEGRCETDPSESWYKGEMGFYDFYIIPLARKLKDCGVFGVASDEYLSYAVKNRQEWESKGQAVVEEMVERVQKKKYGQLHDSFVDDDDDDSAEQLSPSKATDKRSVFVQNTISMQHAIAATKPVPNVPNAA
jgi:hypothetical protein